MTINLDEYKQGEPITIIHNGMKKIFYDTNVLVPIISNDVNDRIPECVDMSWQFRRFKIEIYGKDVEISETGNN